MSELLEDKVNFLSSVEILMDSKETLLEVGSGAWGDSRKMAQKFRLIKYLIEG